MTQKSQTPHLLESFITFAQHQFHATIKAVRTDNGLEFLSMRDFFHKHGIEFQRTCVYTPQQNGVVERKHRHILNTARALLFQSHMPLEFWGECVLTSVHIINRLPSPLLKNKTPFELLYHRPPSLSHLRVFGCLSYATVVHPKHKFDSRARRCVFVGYPSTHKGYKLFDLESQNFIISRDVIFHENIFPFQQSLQPSSPPSVLPNLALEIPSSYPPIPNTEPHTIELIPDPTTEPDVNPSPIPAPAPPIRRSERIKHLPTWHKDYVVGSQANASTSSTRYPL